MERAATDVVVVLEAAAAPTAVDGVIAQLRAFGFEVHRPNGRPGERPQAVVLSAVGAAPDFDVRHVKVLEGVKDVFRVTSPYKLPARTWHPEDSVVDVDGVLVGGNEVVVMAGPCAVESEAQIDATAAAVAAAGARILRGGAFKPRTSPYSFQGLGVDGLRMLRQAADRYGLRVVTEAMRPSQLDAVAHHAHVIQIGARNMQNFPLLQEAGRMGLPVLLKRGMSATVEDWLMSAEYVMAEGNAGVILCERGIRTFETATRNTLDLGAVAVVKQRSHLPVFVDPSHAVGLRDKVTPLARAAVAVGADGLMVEAHPDPTAARSDGPQSLYLDDFAELMDQVRRVAVAVGRVVAPARPAADLRLSAAAA